MVRRARYTPAELRRMGERKAMAMAGVRNWQLGNIQMPRAPGDSKARIARYTSTGLRRIGVP